MDSFQQERASDAFTSSLLGLNAFAGAVATGYPTTALSHLPATAARNLTQPESH